MIRHVRPKAACTGCYKRVQASAPERPIARGIAGPGLLAQVMLSKYCDHLPLYRQSQIYARDGVDLPRSILADWVCETSHLLAPWSKPSGVIPCQEKPCMRMIPQSRSCHLARDGQRLGGCGPMFVMNGLPKAMRRRRSGLPIHPTVKGSALADT